MMACECVSVTERNVIPKDVDVEKTITETIADSELQATIESIILGKLVRSKKNFTLLDKDCNRKQI